MIGGRDATVGTETAIAHRSHAPPPRVAEAPCFRVRPHIDVGAISFCVQHGGDFVPGFAQPLFLMSFSGQYLGGRVLVVCGELPNVIIVLIVLQAWYVTDTKRSRVADEKCDTEGTPELDSYNAYLASLARAGHGD